MFTSKVTDPKGNTWRVGLVILPNRKGIGLRERFRRKRKNKAKDSHFLDDFDISFIDSLDEVWFLVLLVFLLIVGILVGWPLLLVLLDLLWFFLVTIGALISFGLLRRPITIRAYTKEKIYKWQVSGFRNALTRKNNIADKLANGLSPESL